MALDQTFKKDAYMLSGMPAAIQILAEADLPELAPYKDEWIQFLWQRGAELIYQSRLANSERDFVENMPTVLDLFWKEEHAPEYNPALLQAIKDSLYEIILAFDSAEEDTALRLIEERLFQTTDPWDDFAPEAPYEAIIPAKSSAPIDFETTVATKPARPKRQWIKDKTDFAADKTTTAYTWARNTLYSGIVTATYAFTAAVVADIAYHHEAPETSYTAQFIAKFQQTPR